MREIAVVIALALASRPVSARPIIMCTDLIRTSFGTEVKIASAVSSQLLLAFPNTVTCAGPSGGRPDLR